MFEITQDQASGVRHAIDPETGRHIMVLPDGPSRLFRRHAVKRYPDGRNEEVTWLVAELDGVRAYLEGDHLVLTRQELYP